ncbi:unnamed protein product [Brachionus calyciflorus]|uniref:Uncharacterized protein n=1 Tax=Brachionus calyciflorus TaxID=104777 RepID=A0A813MCC5_9BILA|nr:unnamed protein product [Brachionus calyciflorus]
MNVTILNTTTSTEVPFYNSTLQFFNATVQSVLKTNRTSPFAKSSIFRAKESTLKTIATNTTVPITATTKSLLALIQFSLSSTKFNSNNNNNGSVNVRAGLRNNLNNNFCACDRSVPISNKIYSQDDNIWKLAFFALAFIVGLISIMLILTFSTKILLNRFSKKSDYNNSKKNNGSKKPRKVSSISLLDFDADLASNYAPSSIPNRKKRSLSSPSSTESARIKLRPESSSDSTVYSSQNLFNDLIKSPNQAESVSRQQSYIYGVTNKAFQDDNEKVAEKCERIVSFRKQNNNIPSSFKPFEKRIAEIALEKNDKILEQDAYMQPWKLPGITDDYEVLEINPIIESAALSPATTFSECYSERQQNEPNFNIQNNKIKDFSLMCMNNNELISKSSKITQELEKKLKERRQMMESKSDKLHCKLIEEGKLDEYNATVSLSALEKRIQNWQNELNTKLSKKNTMKRSSSSCVCPCHSNLCNSKNRSCEKRANAESKDLWHRTSFQNRQITKAKDKDKNYESSSKSKNIPKIVIDNAVNLPTKRESIRALMETKTVTQNKQKEVLEMHLNTLISTRRSCKISE